MGEGARVLWDNAMVRMKQMSPDVWIGEISEWMDRMSSRAMIPMVFRHSSFSQKLSGRDSIMTRENREEHET